MRDGMVCSHSDEHIHTVRGSYARKEEVCRILVDIGLCHETNWPVKSVDGK